MEIRIAFEKPMLALATPTGRQFARRANVHGRLRSDQASPTSASESFIVTMLRFAG
jgi:hypothetical protein